MLNINFGKGLIRHIHDGLAVEPKMYLKHHFFRGVEITLGSTIQNGIGIIGASILPIVTLLWSWLYLPQYSKEIFHLSSIIAIVCITERIVMQIAMLLMATIRSMAQEYRNIESLKNW